MFDSTLTLPAPLTLAQDDIAPPALPGEDAAPSAVIEGDAPLREGGGPPASTPGFGGDFILIVILLIGAMFLFSIFAQRKERKKREAMLSGVKKHDRVQTIGGVIGSVVEIKPETVVLKVDESANTRMTFARSAIQQVLKEAPEKS